MKTLSANIKTKIISPDFDFAQSAKMRACIEISANEIVTALFSAESEIMYLQHHIFKAGEKITDAFEYLINSDVFFSQTYAHTYISVANGLYTMVPNALYNNENKQQWLTFNHTINDEMLVLCDDVYSADSKCVYAVNQKLKTLIDATFPNNYIKHKTTCMAESLAGIASKKYKTCLVNVSTDSFDVALYNHKMVFFNSFEYQSSEDFLYFILASLEQNNFPVDETEVTLAGEIEVGSALHDTIKQYLPKLKFAVVNKSIVRKGEFETMSHHFYYSLFNLYLCAL